MLEIVVLGPKMSLGTVNVGNMWSIDTSPPVISVI